MNRSHVLSAVFIAASSLPVLAPHPIALFIALMLAGSAISFVELGLNVEADLVEKATGKLIMNTSHGCWSLGIMVGSLFGSGFAALGFQRLHFPCAGGGQRNLANILGVRLSRDPAVMRLLLSAQRGTVEHG